MKYVVKHIFTGKVVAEGDKTTVIRFFLRESHLFVMTWAWKPSLNFNKDRLFRSLSMTDTDLYIPDSFTLPTQRLYRVFDEDGRVVDPRSWVKEINAIMTSDNPMGYQTLMIGPIFSTGKKCHIHRNVSSAMRHQTLRMAADQLDLEEDIEILRKHINVRDRGMRAEYKDKFLTKSRSKSWKDQFHSSKQWAKHNPCTGRRISYETLMDTMYPEENDEDAEEFLA